ncbi:hypothetical protein [Amycolatopsis anabasis]|uniref:hypothetical protein n=1 Tax=Amycolatopsis anabasis TaxID=1840409 RepID=UPI00131DBB83|nr:hypothetical protein [Amycolatopsis anabasis]
MDLNELPPILYHYTCNHRLNGIIAERALLPNPHPWLGAALVWLTDLHLPDRSALGFTIEHLGCDRTENRVEVRPTTNMQPWPHWAHHHAIPALARDMIEGGGALPTRWWVSPAPVEVLAFDRARGHLGRRSA